MADAPNQSLAQSQSSRPPSKRWSHFHSALQLAIQRATHKWTFEDYKECFSLWCQEEFEGASDVFNILADQYEQTTTTRCEAVLEQYNARENIDILHDIVTEARAKRKAGEAPGKDVWREGVDPRTAARARTIPVLRKEKERLEAQLAALEAENLETQNQMKLIMDDVDKNRSEEKRRLDVLDELEAKWNNLNIEDIQEWTLRTAETAPSGS